jgi:hypothetical protein
MNPPGGNRYELSLLVLYGFSFKGGQVIKTRWLKTGFGKMDIGGEKKLECHQAPGWVA